MKFITVGRSKENNVVIDDPQVALHHSQIVQDATGKILLSDLNSESGTFVNGQKVTHVSLQKGDEVKVGSEVVQWEEFFLPTRQRHGFVSFWLSFGIFFFFLYDFFFMLCGVEEFFEAKWMGDSGEFIMKLAVLHCIVSFSCIISVVGYVLLIKWKKVGFWISAIGLTSMIFVNIWMLMNNVYFSFPLIFSIIFLLMGIALFGILQIRKNEKSCWKHLK